MYRTSAEHIDTVGIAMQFPELTSRAERLQWAARLRGCKSASDLARLVEKGESTVRSHWNGTRVFSRPWAVDYARRLDVPFPWLWEGILGMEITKGTSSSAPKVAQLAHLILSLDSEDQKLVEDLVASLSRRNRKQDD